MRMDVRCGDFCGRDIRNTRGGSGNQAATQAEFISMFTLDKPFKTILIGNPEIVAATAQDDRTVVLTPQAVGETNIIFLDERNVQITSINVLVNEGAGRVHNYNKKLLTSFTVYRCWENRCEYVNEVAAKEPAPLPSGHLNQK